MELLASIAIIAALVAISIPFVGNYVVEARRQADQRTLTTLNDALNRYKTEGGSLSSLTQGAPVCNILNRIASTINWNGLAHNVVRLGYTVRSHSLMARGVGKTYRFVSYNGVSAGGDSDGSNISVNANVATLAGYGLGGSGYQDGPVGVAKLTADPGNIDWLNGKISFARGNSVCTLDMAAGVVGTEAITNNPYAVRKGNDGRYYVCSMMGHSILTINGYGYQVYAGTGTQGSLDGTLATAQFNYPNDIAFDASGNMYVAEWGGSRLRKIDTLGNVTTIAPLEFFDHTGATRLRSLVYDPNTNTLYISCQYQGILAYNLTSLTTRIVVENHSVDYFGIVLNQSTGMLYVAAHDQHVIYSVPAGSTNGTLTLVAGVVGVSGCADGNALTATFDCPTGLAIGPDGSLYVAHGYGSSHPAIRKISNP